MVKLGPNFCYCAIDQEKPFFNKNGPFLSHLPFGTPKWSNLLRISAIVPSTKKRPFLSGNGPFLGHLPFGSPKW